MENDKERMEYAVLTIIRDAGQPVGCGAISSVLQGRGYTISEATVGRILRDFDIAGYTEKAGYQGRKLSNTGLERINQLDSKQKSLQWGAELADAIKAHTKEQLLEVLVARRAIESELAALAACNGSEEERRELAEILERQRVTLASGRMAAQEDVDFHSQIAHMARNRVLKAAIALIRQDTQLSRVLEFIRKHVHSVVYIDHKIIFTAINLKLPEQAKEATIEHINNLIQDVEKYWERTD